MKITIIGFAGGGKSTLARKISKQFNIPHLELDKLYFSNGGDVVKPDDTEEKDRIREVMKQEVSVFLENNKSWVSDGTYSKIQPIIAEQADQVLYLDFPLWQRQLNHIKRVVRNDERHPEIPLYQDIYFLYDMFRRTREGRKTFHELLNKHKNKLTKLKSYKQIDDWLAKLV